jgi:hypothetical protein
VTISQYVKNIEYNRSTKDYDLKLDGRYVGSARTHHEGEVVLDQLVYELLNAQSPVDDDNVCEVCFGEGDCPRCNQPTTAPTCATCGGEGDCPDCSPIVDLATDLYNVVCLTLSGAAATTAIAELKRVAARYESEVKK